MKSLTIKEKAKVLDRLYNQAQGMIMANDSNEEELNYEEWHLAKYNAKAFLKALNKSINKIKDGHKR